MKGVFLFTIDTEWDRYPDGRQDITTYNLARIESLHALCLEEGIRPTYFCSYEVTANNEFLKFGKRILQNNEAEIGTHLHPWSTPPVHQIELYKRTPFPNEYPLPIFEEKLSTLKTMLEYRFGTQFSYRAGRFGVVKEHLAVLKRLGFISDSSVTPHLSWAGLGGPDFTTFNAKPFCWNLDSGNSNFMLEIPVGIFLRYPVLNEFVKRRLGNHFNRLFLSPLWLRPLPGQIKRLSSIAAIGVRQGHEVLHMMMHSNELHPNYNPYFKSDEDVENLLKHLRSFFRWIHESTAKTMGFLPLTVNEFARLFSSRINNQQ